MIADGSRAPPRLVDEGGIRALVGALGKARRGLFQIIVGTGTDMPFLESLATTSSRPDGFIKSSRSDIQLAADRGGVPSGRLWINLGIWWGQS